MKKSAPNLFLHPKTGVYYVRKMVNGRRRKISTGEKSFWPATRKAAEILSKLHDQKQGWNRKQVLTLSEWWQTYEETYLPSLKSPHVYRQAFAQVSLVMQRMPLDQLTTSVCQRYVNELKRRYSPSTVCVYTTAMLAILSKARQEGAISQNPFTGIERGKVTIRQRVLTEEEQDHLLSILHPSGQRWLSFMLNTGLRISESATITPEDVVFERQLMRVVGKGEKERWVPLFPKAAEVLKAQIAAEGHLWNFTRVALGKWLRKAARSAGIKGVTPHTLRHTFATRFLQAGGDIYKLSLILGHSSVTITERIYAHLLQSDLVAAIQGIQLERPAKVVKGAFGRR